MWPNRRLLDLLQIEIPIIQAPMAGSVTSDMTVAVAEAGGLGSLPCTFLDHEAIRAEVSSIRARTARPVNLNFFCHQPPRFDPDQQAAWRERLADYYSELGLGPDDEPTPLSPDHPNFADSFDSATCDLLVELAPAVVSFHFGLPDQRYVDRLRAAGARILSSATTVEEARWLEAHGCDAIIAQGSEAGGHRGMFLTDNAATQVGTMALVPQIVDAVTVPVIAAGGIADGRGIAAAFALGASGVQIGTGYLGCPEASVSPLHLDALRQARVDQTAITNVLTGRPARAIVNRLIRETGPISNLAPAFPLAGAVTAPLRDRAEAAGSSDFTSLYAGQAAALGRSLPAGEMTRRLATEALATLAHLSPVGSN
jgi:nitronate monooxygenase